MIETCVSRLGEVITEARCRSRLQEVDALDWPSCYFKGIAQLKASPDKLLSDQGQIGRVQGTEDLLSNLTDVCHDAFRDIEARSASTI